VKIVTAIIKPLMLDAVTDALVPLGIGGMTVLEVKGFGQQRGFHDQAHHTSVTMPPRRHGDRAVQFISKVRLDVAVTDGMVDTVVETIIAAAHTGRVGDGKVFVTDLPQVVRIRNHEIGDDAL